MSGDAGESGEAGEEGEGSAPLLSRLAEPSLPLLTSTRRRRGLEDGLICRAGGWGAMGAVAWAS